MSLCFRQRRKKNAAHELLIHTVPCTVNRLLAERKAAVVFEGIWKILYDFKSNPDFSRGDFNTTKVPQRDFFTEKLFFLPD
jgi:hypothetical protein